MQNILQIKGKVKFPIAIDPGVWIFDDRKIDLNTYFDLPTEERPDELSLYKKSISKQWDREITEGVTVPPTPQRITQKELLLTGTFGMVFKPFLKNSEPFEDAKIFVIEMQEGNLELPLVEAYELILAFSKDGKPLLEDGPIHIFFGDGSNKQNPLTKITGFQVK